jgi:long-chain acyl-CoA synthetase
MNSPKVLKQHDKYSFYSSGTTGSPRRISVNAEVIHREVAYLATLFASRLRINYFVPLHHIYGYIWAVLLPEALRIEAIPFATPRPGDLLIGHPGTWRRWQTLPADIWGINAGGPGNPPPGLEQWLDVYGSTETAGAASRTSPDQPFELFPYWPDYFEGPDHIRWLSPRHFFLEGRKDGAIQVCGTNVSLAYIRSILSKCPNVNDITLKTNPARRLTAVVVGSATESELVAWAAANLTPAEQPATYEFKLATPPETAYPHPQGENP